MSATQEPGPTVQTDDPTPAAPTARWHLTLAGLEHRVEIVGTVSRTSSWYVDDELVASKKSTEDRVVLEDAGFGDRAVGLTFDALGRARRVTVFEGDGTLKAKARAALGTGGIDLDPEAGSYAARRQERIRQHPRRHAALAVAAGVAKVGVPLVLGLLVVRFAVSLPWPHFDLPRIPWPDIDLPRIPWPDINLPHIPWPNIQLPDWQAPAWVGWVLDRVKYVWPIVVAVVLVRGEIVRQRKQDALKAKLQSEQERSAVSGAPGHDRAGDEDAPAADAER
jgi:hypothetical protein